MKCSVSPSHVIMKFDSAKFALPLLSGVRGLSRSEIRKDLQEIEHFDKSDCESVSSAASDDVLPSSYPVKPRAHARVLKEHRVSRVLKNEVDNADTLESALEFMRVVEAARPEIFEAEREREDLEIRFEALREMCIIEERSFQKKKTLHENYLGAVQLSCRNSACEFQLRSDYNSLLCDLIMSIRSHKKLIRDYSVTNRPFASLPAHCSDDEGPSGDENGPVPPPLPSRPVAPAIVFYTTQILNTPMGPGEVFDINTTTQTLTIRLPFGVMYAVFDSVATWLSCHKHTPQADFHHPANIQGRWSDPHQASLGINISREIQIRRILCPPASVPPPDVPDTSTMPMTARDSDDPPPSHSKATCRRSATDGGGAKAKKGRALNSRKQLLAPAQTNHTHTQLAKTGATSTTPAASKTVSMCYPEDNSDRSGDTYLCLDPVPRIGHLFLRPDALPLVAGPYLSPPSARPSSTCALQLCRQVLTGSYQHRHKDLDEKFLNYPVKDNVDLQGVMEGEGNESVIVPFADEGVTVKTAENGSGGNEVSAVYAVDGENTGMNVEGVTSNLRAILKRIGDCTREKNTAAQEVERLKRKTTQLYHEMSCTRLGLFTERMLNGSEDAIASTVMGGDGPPELSASSLRNSADRRYRSGGQSRQAGNGHTNISVGAVHKQNGAIVDDSASSVESVVQYTYDSIGRRRAVKHTNISRNNKRRSCVASTIDVSVGDSVHIVKVTEVVSDQRRPKRPRR